MPKPLQQIIQFFGLYRAAEALYSIWAGKSLLWLAIVSLVPVVISTIAGGFRWELLDRYVLAFAAIYATFSIAWLATIMAYRAISPKNKFVVVDFNFNCNPIPHTTPHSNPTAANDFQAVIRLQNTATFPISYIIDDIDFRIQNTVSNNNFANRGAVIDAGQPSQFSSGIVTFHHPVNLPTTGTLRATIKYGAHGKETFSKPISLRVLYVADASIQTGIRHYWNND